MTMAMQYTSLALFGPIGWPEIVVILVVILLLFGGKRLPELARGLGRGLRLFKKEVRGVKEEIESAVDLDAEDETDKPKPGDTRSPDEGGESDKGAPGRQDEKDKP